MSHWKRSKTCNQNLFFLLFGLPLVGLFLTFCAPQNPFEKYAQDFLKIYYEEANLEKALNYSTGFASEKIKNEIRLGGGQATKEQRSRKFSYHLTHSSVHPDRKDFFFNIEIQTGKESFKRKVRITLVLPESSANPKDWKVSNFVDAGS